MRRALWITGILFLLLVAYILWPVAGFYRLASAIEANDSAALGRVVDFPALRKSLTKQLVHAYLELTGKKREKQEKPKLSLIERTVALGIGNSIAEPIVAQLVNEKTLLEFLTKGYLRTGGGKGDGANKGIGLPGLAPFNQATAASGWQIWLGTEYRGDDVFVYLPPNKPRSQQFRVKFNLTDWQWKLAGLDLPDPLLMQLVKELVAQQKEKQE